MYLESSKPIVEHHEYGAQDSTNAETKVNPSGVHRETVASTKVGKSQPPRRQQLRQRQQQQQSFIDCIQERSPLKERKISNERTEYGRNNWIRRNTWTSTSLLHERAYQITNAKVYIFSDSVLYLCGKRCEMIRVLLGKTTNGIQRIITSRSWIASTVCSRSSSGKCSQDSRRGASSKRFKTWWKVFSVNLSSSTTGSLSCQCTVHGEKTETQKSVFWILLKLRSMLACSLAVVGRSWDLDQKMNGMGPIPINQTEIGTELQKWWCSN